jgi:hypothetical protein
MAPRLDCVRGGAYHRALFFAMDVWEIANGNH